MAVSTRAEPSGVRYEHNCGWPSSITFLCQPIPLQLLNQPRRLGPKTWGAFRLFSPDSRNAFSIRRRSLASAVTDRADPSGMIVLVRRISVGSEPSPRNIELTRPNALRWSLSLSRRDGASDFVFRLTLAPSLKTLTTEITSDNQVPAPGSPEYCHNRSRLLRRTIRLPIHFTASHGPCENHAVAWF